MEIIQVNNPKHSNDRVYDVEGISPCLNTMQGGNRQPFIAEKHTIAYSKSTRKDHIDARGKIDDEANTLSTGDGCVNQSTGNYVFTKGSIVTNDQEENILKLASIDNQSRKQAIFTRTIPEVEINVEAGVCIATRHLGRNGKLTSDISSIIQVSEIPHVTYREQNMSDIKLLAGQTAPNQDRKSLYKQKGRVYSSEGISPTITTEADSNASIVVEEDNMLNPRILKDLEVSKEEIRIRKLTPTECERLQGYPDSHTKLCRKSDGTVYEISNSQRYKMCGNGVSSPVTAYLFPAIFGNQPIRIMSLFSGCGGTELLLPSNFQVVGHCEFDKYASDVLRYHYPNIPNFHDVTQFIDKEVSEFDLLTFGYPCQDVSIAGNNLGENGKRTSLIWNVCDIIEKHKPKFIMAENVKNHLSKKHEAFFTRVLERLSELGYDLDFEVVNSKHFSLPQNRERVFIFGKLK
jgi:site-specific DNA-cytosine methylase